MAASKKKSSAKRCPKGYVKSRSTKRCVFATGTQGRKLNKKRASVKKSHKREGRPSPNVSAKSVAIGTVRKGLDGNKWIVKAAGKSQRWVRFK